MKTGSYSLLLELCVMTAVFAVAALLGVRAFLLARDTAEASAERDHAVICASNEAEAIKAARQAEAAERHFDASWHEVDTPDVYLLSVAPLASGLEGLGSARIRVLRADGTELCALTVSWQEVSP